MLGLLSLLPSVGRAAPGGASPPPPNAPSWFRPSAAVPGRRVLAHYFPQFPIAYDDRAAAEDYYETQYLRPEGENGKFAAVGGMVRERPSASPWVGKGRPDWQERNMDEEIRRARAAGLDGFTVDLWGTSGRPFEDAKRLLDAAARTGGAFDVVLMPDMAILGARPEGALDIVRALGHRAGVARTADGRLILSPYLANLQPPAWWKAGLGKLKAEGFPIAFLPTFQEPERFEPAYRALSVGCLDWVGAAKGGQGLRVSSAIPQYFRPNAKLVQPTVGSVDYRRMWQAGIDAGSNWMHVVSWNDYSEATEIAPSSGIGTSFSELTAYYAAWFRAGKAPGIVRDKAFAFYRPFLAPRPGQPGADWRGATGLSNDAEVLTFLTAPAEIRARIGTHSYVRQAPAGMTSSLFPLTGGKATFSIVRYGASVAILALPRSVCPAGSRADFLTLGVASP